MRVDRWELILADALERAVETPFEWGVNDCATWAFDLRARLRGEASAAERWRGIYRSAAGARRTMRRLGWADYEAMANDLCGPSLPNVRLAQRGDIVLAGSGIGFGIAAGGFVVGLTEDGWRTSPLSACAAAWRT